MEKLLVPIETIKLWENNPREISDKDFQSLKGKIERWGIWKPFLVWESKKQILGGNQRYKACKELGHKEIWVEYREPKDDAEALEMAIADNESSGEWVKSLLIEQIKLNQDKINLEDYKINIKDTTLKDLMPIDAEEDNPPDEADVKSVSVLGDLYELGNHRVLCGDSTSVDNVEKLMNGKKADMVFTDPPYGVSYEQGKFTGSEVKNKFAPIKNDELRGEGLYKFINDVFLNIYIHTTDNAVYYVWSPPTAEAYEIRRGVADTDVHIQSQLVWNKGRLILGRADYQWAHELCWYGYKGKNHFWCGDRQQTSIWTQVRDVKYIHPTQKPLELAVRAIKNSTQGSNNIVIDAFLGSGSTLIACEKTERICYGMELDTHYTDVIVARYIKYMQDNGKSFTIKRNGEEIDYNLFLKDGK